MKKILIILNSLKNLLPYFFIIAIYFFFVNLEARKEKVKTQEAERKSILANDKPSFEDEVKTLVIPVIPYNQ